MCLKQGNRKVGLVLLHLLNRVDVNSALALVDRDTIDLFYVTFAQAIEEVVDVLSRHNVHVVRLVLKVHALFPFVAFKFNSVDHPAVDYKDELVFFFVKFSEILLLIGVIVFKFLLFLCATVFWFFEVFDSSHDPLLDAF